MHTAWLHFFYIKAWGDCVSDIDITEESGLINPNLHHHVNQILHDHSFTLQGDFTAGCGVELFIFSFTKGKNSYVQRRWKYLDKKFQFLSMLTALSN